MALPEDVNALYPFSSEIFYLSILVQQKVFLGSQFTLFSSSIRNNVKQSGVNGLKHFIESFDIDLALKI